MFGCALSLHLAELAECGAHCSLHVLQHHEGSHKRNMKNDEERHDMYMLGYQTAQHVHVRLMALWFIDTNLLLRPQIKAESQHFTFRDQPFLL